MYSGWDASTTMATLSAQRLQRFGSRARVGLSTEITRLPVPDASADRFVSNYVLDILSFDEIAALVAEARRILQPSGLLCLTGLTFGQGWFSKAWTAFWQARFAIASAIKLVSPQLRIFQRYQAELAAHPAQQLNWLTSLSNPNTTSLNASALVRYGNMVSRSC